MQTASAGEGKECTISGTSGLDTLVGTDSSGRICGFDVVDFIEALCGDDHIIELRCSFDGVVT
jgi:hypothetical protein